MWCDVNSNYNKAKTDYMLFFKVVTCHHVVTMFLCHHRYQNYHNGSPQHMQSWLPLTIPIQTSLVFRSPHSIFLVQQNVFEIGQEFIVFNVNNLFSKKIQNILNKKRLYVQAPKITTVISRQISLSNLVLSGMLYLK